MARVHAGAFTLAQAVAAGLSRDAAYRRVRRGTWVRLAGDGICHADHTVTPMTRAHAARLSWSDAIVFGPTAAALYGAPVRTSGPVHVAVPDTRKPRHDLRPHRRHLGPLDIEVRAGLRVTTEIRSNLDSLAILPIDDARDLLAWLVPRRRLARTDIEDHLAGQPHVVGNSQLRTLWRESASGALSVAEQRAHQVLITAGIAGWEANATVSDARGIVGSVDILFRAARIVVEIDGARAHGGEAFRRDRERQNRLIAAGYLVLRYTWHHVTREPHVMVREIRHLLATREHERPARS